MRTSNLSLVLLLAVTPALAAGPENPAGREGLFIKVEPRTATQMASFYEARGFPANAISLLSRHCFVGVIIKNDTDKVVWLEPDRWRVVPAGAGNGSPPLTLGYWTRHWQQIGLPRPQQATFRWTQMPQSRDLRPQEPVGGNISVRSPGRPFTLVLRFATGPDRSGPEILRRFEDLRCR